MKLSAKIRSKGDSFFSLYPSLMTLFSILTVLLTALLTGWGTLMLTGVVLVLTGIGLFLTGVRHTFFRTVLPSFLLLCSLFLREREPLSDELNRMLDFRQSAGAVLEMTVDDMTLFRTGTGASSEDLLPPPGRIPCRVTAFSFSEGEPLRPLKAGILLALPERFRNIPLCYGMGLRGKGVLRRVEPPLLPELFDYSFYLENRKIHYVFYPEELSSAGSDGSFLTAFFRFRDRILASVLKGIRTQEARSLAGGMLFGCRQGLTQENRQEFLRSGLIHIFTVSGLHIGLFASGVFLLLSFLPLRWKMTAGILLVWIYGLMTGLQMPSLRALIMLSCWALPRAFKLPHGGLNSLFLAGSVLLILSPHQIREAGFHYSFLCVIFLLTAGGSLSRFLLLLREKEHFHPEGNRSPVRLCRNRIIRSVLCFLAGCSAAWACSFILTACHQSVSIHLAAPANAVILIHAYCIFLVFTVFFLPLLLWEPSGKIAGGLLETLLFSTEKISAAFSRWTGENALSALPWYLAAASLVLVWTVLQFPGKKRAAGALCILGVLILWYLFYGSTPRNELLLFSGGTQKGSFWCLSLPEEDFCAAGGIPDFRTASQIAQYLKRRGHNSLTVLVTSAKESFRGEESFLAGMMKTETLLRLRKSPSRRTAGRSAAASAGSRYGRSSFLDQDHPPCRIRHGKMFFEILWKKTQISFDILQKSGKLSFSMTPDGTGHDLIQVHHPETERTLNFVPEGEHRRTVKRIHWDPGKIWIR